MTNPLTKSAVRFRLVMTVVLILLCVLVVALATVGVRRLDRYAKEVSTVVYEADTSEEKLNNIRRMSAELDRQQDVAARARQIVAESKSYQYQDVIIADLQAMAARAGLRITNFDFTAGTAAGTTGAAPAPAAGSSAPAASAPPATGAPAATPGSSLKSTTVNITLDGEMEYRQLLNFIHYIEQNVTKMQIASVTMSRSGDNGSKVTTDSLTIEVYIR